MIDIHNHQAHFHLLLLNFQLLFQQTENTCQTVYKLSYIFSYKYQKMLSNLCRIPVLFIFFYIYTVSTIDNYGTKNIYYTIFSQRMRERVFYVRSGFVQDQDLFRDRRDIITFVP